MLCQFGPYCIRCKAGCEVAKTDSGAVRQKLPGRQRRRALGRLPARKTIGDRSIEIEAPGLGQPHRAPCSDGLGDRLDPEQRIHRHLAPGGRIGVAEGAGPDRRAVLQHGDDNPRHAVTCHACLYSITETV